VVWTSHIGTAQEATFSLIKISNWATILTFKYQTSDWWCTTKELILSCALPEPHRGWARWWLTRSIHGNGNHRFPLMAMMARKMKDTDSGGGDSPGLGGVWTRTVTALSPLLSCANIMTNLGEARWGGWWDDPRGWYRRRWPNKLRGVREDDYRSNAVQIQDATFFFSKVTPVQSIYWNSRFEIWRFLNTWSGVTTILYLDRELKHGHHSNIKAKE
jgi:hypothetical protein